MLLPEEVGERCQAAVADWLLWAHSFTQLGLSLHICKMGPRAGHPPPCPPILPACCEDEADMGVRSLGVCALKAWQALRAERMRHKGVGLEVLEAFSRNCSPIQGYLPGSLLSSLGLHAPHDREFTTLGQFLPLVDSSDYRCAQRHAFWKSTSPDLSGLEELGILQTTDLYFPG